MPKYGYVARALFLATGAIALLGIIVMTLTVLAAISAFIWAPLLAWTSGNMSVGPALLFSLCILATAMLLND